MKKLNLILLAVFFLSTVFISCNKEEEEVAPETIIPKNFRVEIPSSLSSSNSTKSYKGDTISGNEIYGHLRFFIHVGNSAAHHVEIIMRSIAFNDLNQAMSFSYTSTDDGRVKNINILENSEFEGKVYEYQLTMTDALSENEEDGGIGMQIFWDRNPVKGIAIFKLYNIDRDNTEGLDKALYRVDYSEAGENGYEKQMTVSISDLPMSDSLYNIYTLSSMKMFAGQKGDIIDVYGNSNHPFARFFSEENVGFNWAFVASADTLNNISIAEVGLPWSYLDTESREEILIENSIKNVFTKDITAMIEAQYGFTPTPEQLEPYLQNTNAPGYFDNGGFIAAGTSPNANYSELETSILNLVPYNPFSVSNLKIEFKIALTK